MKKLLLTLLFCFFIFPIAAEPNYEAIDKYAKNAPPLRTQTGLPKLVQYLVKPYKTDAEKARVLLAWIVYNIQYDFDKAERNNSTDIEIKMLTVQDPKTGKYYLDNADVHFKKLRDTTNETLRTRMGICKDIALLYQKMAQMAGLQVEVIMGYACDQSDDFRSSEAHMWNAVKIDNRWMFVDPTWATMGDIVIEVNSSEEAKKVERQLKQRKSNLNKIKGVRKNFVEKWFLVDREEIIKTHFPIERKWQLQKKRVHFENFLQDACGTSFNEFLKQMDKKR